MADASTEADEDPCRIIEVTLLWKESRPRSLEELRPITMLDGSYDGGDFVDFESDVGMHGFRKVHQCSEVISVVRFMIERSMQWSQTE